MMLKPILTYKEKKGKNIFLNCSYNLISPSSSLMLSVVCSVSVVIVIGLIYCW